MNNNSKNLKISILDSGATIKDAMQSIESSGRLMACFVDELGRLLGIVTDADLRRLLLKGHELTDRIDGRFNRNPIVAREGASRESMDEICRFNGIKELPICKDDGVLTSVFVHHHFFFNDNLNPMSESEKVKINCAMLISAGGKGTRLQSVVADRPKPLAVVGGRPILRTIIDKAQSFGITEFYISVNHMAEMIESHLDQECYKNISIKVLKESKPLGTAGAIGLIGEIDKALIVTNADVLTTTPLDKMLDMHMESNGVITCGLKEHSTTIPFGVVDVANGEIVAIKEKPEVKNFVNAGIYILEPSICNSIVGEKYIDMPDIIQAQIAQGGKIVPFLMHEYWIDIGRPDEFFRANKEYEKYFKNLN